MTDWKNIDYLKHGNNVQKEVHTLLEQLDIMRLLEKYDPVLVGTVPIGIQVNGSDLDIICEVYEPEEFKTVASRNFGDMDEFTMMVIYI